MPQAPRCVEYRFTFFILNVSRLDKHTRSSHTRLSLFVSRRVIAPNHVNRRIRRENNRTCACLYWLMGASMTLPNFQFMGNESNGRMETMEKNRLAKFVSVRCRWSHERRRRPPDAGEISYGNDGNNLTLITSGG